MVIGGLYVTASWRSVWANSVNFRRGVAISSMKKEEKWAEGGGGEKNVKALFLNVFCTTKVFERVLQYPFVRKRLLSDFSVQISHNAS